MNVIEALNARHSTRAFLPAPVEKDKLNAILEAALRTPSWANSQPWEIFVATGGTLDRVKKAYLKKYEEKAPAAPETPRPAEWSQAAKDRQKQLAPDMKRDCGDAVDQFGKLNQNMFYAPCAVFVCMDKILSEWSLYDIGAYSQSLMLAAREYGVASIPAITMVLYPDVLRQELKIPDHLKITIGIALGYVDENNAINKFVSARSALSEVVRFLD
ncbi:MAG: nitroreductase [Peptococcaceae bacterium]|jgi:nitroreductase|nr:nitroreductase [Peptococcaceae bacterium]